MEYKLYWAWRLQNETEILSIKYRYYEISTSSHERFRNNIDQEVVLIISMVHQKRIQKSIANALGQSIGQSFIKLKNSAKITYYKSSFIFCLLKKRP